MIGTVRLTVATVARLDVDTRLRGIAVVEVGLAVTSAHFAHFSGADIGHVRATTATAALTLEGTAR